jgi:hypothetical protein
VQRAGSNGDFRTISTLKSSANSGESTHSLNYRFEDSAPLIGLSYYRLEINDLSGEKDYSSIVSVDTRNAMPASLHRDESGNYVLRAPGASENSSINATVYSLIGEVIYTSEFLVLSQASYYSLMNAADLHEGIQICTVSVDGRTYTFRLCR